jgi:hypothetical protein
MTDRPVSKPRDEDFLRRWSRLKQEAREAQPPEEAPQPAPPAESLPAEDAQPEDRQEEKPFDSASLPPVESLTKESDYSRFMRPEVPEGLRQKALRRLWATDSVLASPDPLDMHNLDYNAVPTFPEGVKSLFRIGQGMLDELAAEAEKKAADEAALKASAPGESPAQMSAAEKPAAAATEEQPQDAAAQHARSDQKNDLTHNKS